MSNNLPIPLLEIDPYLKPYASDIRKRSLCADAVEKRLTSGKQSLEAFASGHTFFGLHRDDSGWVFREWAPHASDIYLIGDMSDWKEHRHFKLQKKNAHGIWEIHLEPDTFKHKDLYRLSVHWPGGGGDRIPAYARRVVQDPESLIFNAQVWLPDAVYRWQYPFGPAPETCLLIYEAHVGMAQDARRIGTYREFAQNVIPRIADAGYNTIQLMAVQEHPYYGSFGYQVSSFFACSSRFGTPEDLKSLVDTAHQFKLRVIMDLVHSHAVSNEVESLSRFDGTTYQYFHQGHRGYHPAWHSRCFDYAKPEVLHFLLSNCRFWLDEYHFDGFRFDGVTSMLYHHHGLERNFTSYKDYFGEHLDDDAVTYLILANRLIHRVRSDATTLAEEVSGMPGLAAPVSEGGMGFDYRFAMGIPDYWIKLVKDTPDEDWHMGHLWHELNNRRKEEKTISYTESHDQALVGDQALIFRLIGTKMYTHMRQSDQDIIVDRGIALHKMIRLVTLSTASHGYLNFMGNEFGHPEWIDFPREGNDWSYEYARRQWHLADNPALKYQRLAAFDQDMIRCMKQHDIPGSAPAQLLYEHEQDKVLAYERSGLIFLFNFHPIRSHVDYPVNAPPGSYTLLLDSDAPKYAGHGRLASGQKYFTLAENSDPRAGDCLFVYLPTRTAVVLKKLEP